MINLFDFYPEEIFKPLGCTKHKRSYWSLITDIYQAYFADDADTVDSIIDKSLILKSIEDFLVNGTVLLDTSGEITEEFSLNNVQSNASMVFNNLKNWGWFKVDKNGLKVGVYMSPRVGNLIESLSNSRFDMSEQLGSQVYIVRSLIKSILNDKKLPFEELKGMSATAAKEARSISRLMNTLSAEMLVLYEKIGQVNALKDKASLFYEEFVTTTTFQALNSINSNNHPYRYKSEILQAIEKIEFSERKQEIIESWRISGASESDLEKFIANLHAIRRIFDSAAILKERVDKNHGKLVKRFTDSVSYQRRYGNDSGLFESTIKGLKECSEELRIDSPVFYVDTAYYQENFNLPRSQPKPIETKATERKSVSQEEKIRTSLRRNFRRLYRIDNDKLANCLELLFKDTNARFLRSTDIPIDDYYAYLCFANARRLCKQTKKLSRRFKGVLKDYEFKIESEDLENHADVCQCRPFRIIKKG